MRKWLIYTNGGFWRQKSSHAQQNRLVLTGPKYQVLRVRRGGCVRISSLSPTVILQLPFLFLPAWPTLTARLADILAFRGIGPGVPRLRPTVLYFFLPSSAYFRVCSFLCIYFLALKGNGLCTVHIHPDHAVVSIVHIESRGLLWAWEATRERGSPST